MMAAFMQMLKPHGIYFLDSKVGPKSVAYDEARKALEEVIKDAPYATKFERKREKVWFNRAKSGLVEEVVRRSRDPVEVDRGLLVWSLLTAGYEVYAVNPLAAARCRSGRTTADLPSQARRLAL